MSPSGKRSFITLTALSVICVSALLLAVSSLIWLGASNRTEQRAACERSVNGREDNRAVWIHLIQMNPSNPRGREFLDYLNKRLPSLTCGASTTPVPRKNQDNIVVLTTPAETSPSTTVSTGTTYLILPPRPATTTTAPRPKITTTTTTGPPPPASTTTTAPCVLRLTQSGRCALHSPHE